MTYKASDFIQAIPGTGGIISTIKQRVGCSYNTVRRYVDNYPTVAAALHEERERMLDLAESTIIGALAERDLATSKWFLTVKGGERGYAPTSKHEHTGEQGGPIQMTTVQQEIIGVPEDAI